MQPRSDLERRVDRLTAERFDLAVLTARAFDLRAASTYLRLSGVRNVLVERFLKRYPDRVRATMTTDYVERRRRYLAG
jgi:hypothetical protein